MGHGSEPQRQVTDNLNDLIERFKGLHIDLQTRTILYYSRIHINRGE